MDLLVLLSITMMPLAFGTGALYFILEARHQDSADMRRTAIAVALLCIWGTVLTGATVLAMVMEG